MGFSSRSFTYALQELRTNRVSSTLTKTFSMCSLLVLQTESPFLVISCLYQLLSTGKRQEISIATIKV